ncbi:sensor histidine kinase [Alicyclobacillus dauci]|uniref:histidine kinase n=1 Tax=Alicyclobacillus dauci TaxID=1475485 RepID=A0ABY6Z1A4_9BACL|nr:histidine kinase [Alicyclobacillus dauci]WAH36520.1 histidine kinase [Alicyclobacillus dauci]
MNAQFPKKNRRVLYFFLLQLIIPAAYLFPGKPLKVAIGLACIVLFGVIYSLSFAATGNRRVICAIGMMAVMWSMAWWFSPGYFSLVYYPGAVLSFSPIRKLVIGYATLLIGSFTEIYFLYQHYHKSIMADWPSIIGILFGIASMSFMLRYYGKIQEANDKLAAANAEIARLTKVEERARISRDLHDVMGHQLSMITLKAQLATKLLAKGREPDRALTEVRDIEQAAREALTRVREYVADMRQADFGEEWVAAQELLRTAGIECTVADDSQGTETGQAYQVLAMCLREAVTNIVRHSAAKRAFLWVQEKDDGLVHLWIVDDGRGLPAEAEHVTDSSVTDSWSGNGLKGMRARVDSVGGHIAYWWKQTGRQSPILFEAAAHIRWAPSVVLHVSVRRSSQEAETVKEKVQ